MNLIEHLTQCLGEEGCEVAIDCSKSNRFGLDDRNVLDPTGPTNRERLIVELNQLIATADLCAQYGILPADWRTSDQAKQIYAEKQRKVMAFTTYARTKGTLE